ncbi:hypothetical protein [Methylobacterium brachiatum]|uniref:hypothetical protein n=1 Tax=Methylobacterium brachiatum TaxID=269660 RepID=UPI000EFADD54|nr:hypothetical protein [Methylobacterium brachiatum]AYO85370.1 hypothetical protein EBB05_26195 [Methylobacterium brachiatum]
MVKSRSPRAPSRLRTVQCSTCQAAFETRHSQGRYCSEACARDGERKSWRAYGERNRDRRQTYHRAHYAANAEKVITRTAAYLQTPAGRQTATTKRENQKARAPEKIAARHAVKVALQQGRLVRQPCERCGTEPTEAHHPDYSRPLAVMWLCQPCHLAEHGRAPRTTRPVEAAE